MPQQAQVKGKETGTQQCAQEQKRDKEERRKTKTNRPKHHAVRANKYGQAGLEPRHSDMYDIPSISTSHTSFFLTFFARFGNLPKLLVFVWFLDKMNCIYFWWVIFYIFNPDVLRRNKNEEIVSWQKDSPRYVFVACRLSYTTSTFAMNHTVHTCSLSLSLVFFSRLFSLSLSPTCPATKPKTLFFLIFSFLGMIICTYLLSVAVVQSPLVLFELFCAM